MVIVVVEVLLNDSVRPAFLHTVKVMHVVVGCTVTVHSLIVVVIVGATVAVLVGVIGGNV